MRQRGDEVDFDDQEEGPYAGPSGGAVGGTPAEKRSEGGTMDHGTTPASGKLPSDSTIGHDPKPRKRRS